MSDDVNIRHGRDPGQTLKTLTLNEVAPAEASVRAIVPSFIDGV
jgi:hypothetical protein